ncbi:hypothetical protein IWX50DRAFT_627724 [Phyllosticta citricarpa]
MGRRADGQTDRRRTCLPRASGARSSLAPPLAPSTHPTYLPQEGLRPPTQWRRNGSGSSSSSSSSSNDRGRAWNFEHSIPRRESSSRSSSSSSSPMSVSVSVSVSNGCGYIGSGPPCVPGTDTRGMYALHCTSGYLRTDSLDYAVDVDGYNLTTTRADEAKSTDGRRQVLIFPLRFFSCPCLLSLSLASLVFDVWSEVVGCELFRGAAVVAAAAAAMWRLPVRFPRSLPHSLLLVRAWPGLAWPGLFCSPVARPTAAPIVAKCR